MNIYGDCVGRVMQELSCGVQDAFRCPMARSGAMTSETSEAPAVHSPAAVAPGTANMR